MSLQFLGKKSWHTGKLKNQEKVWVEEQKAEAEKKKVAELQKQLEEERQIHELRQIQRASGHAIDDTDGALSWMYEGPKDDSLTSGAGAAGDVAAAPAISAEEREAMLLGKSVKGASAAVSDVKKLSSGGGSSTAAGANMLNSTVSAKNNSFSRLHEDPLLAIKASEQRALEDQVPARLAQMRADIEAHMRGQAGLQLQLSHAHSTGGGEGLKERRRHMKEKKEKKEKKRS